MIKYLNLTDLVHAYLEQPLNPHIQRLLKGYMASQEKAVEYGYIGVGCITYAEQSLRDAQTYHMTYNGKPAYQLYMVDSDNTDPTEERDTILSNYEYYGVPCAPLTWGSPMMLRDMMDIVAKATEWCAGSPKRIVWMVRTPDGLEEVVDYNLFE